MSAPGEWRNNYCVNWLDFDGYVLEPLSLLTRKGRYDHEFWNTWTSNQQITPRAGFMKQSRVRKSYSSPFVLTLAQNWVRVRCHEKFPSQECAQSRLKSWDWFWPVLNLSQNSKMAPSPEGPIYDMVRMRARAPSVFRDRTYALEVLYPEAKFFL